MARSLIQRRQEAERARVEAYEASLRRVSQRARPAPNFHKAIDEAKRGFEADILRDAWAWRPQMKTRDAARLRLAAARYLFARYPVARAPGADLGGLQRARAPTRSCCASAGTSWLPAAVRSTGRAPARGSPARRSMRSSIRWPATSLRGKRSGRRSPVPIRTIPPSRCGSRAPGSHRRRAPSSLLARGGALLLCASDHGRGDGRSARLPRGLPTGAIRSYSLKGRTLASLGRQMRRVAPRPRGDRAYRGRTPPRGGGAGPVRVDKPGTEAAGGGSWPGAAIADWSWKPGGQGSLQARGVSGGPAADSRRSRGRDAGHAPLRRELRGKVHCRATRRSGRYAAAPQARPSGS